MSNNDISINELIEPLTKTEREELKSLSVQAYGKSSKWKSLLSKGETVPYVDLSNPGSAVNMKKVQYFTLQQIKEKMEQIIQDQLKIDKDKEETQSEHSST